MIKRIFCVALILTLCACAALSGTQAELLKSATGATTEQANVMARVLEEHGVEIQTIQKADLGDDPLMQMILPLIDAYDIAAVDGMEYRMLLRKEDKVITILNNKITGEALV